MIPHIMAYVGGLMVGLGAAVLRFSHNGTIDAESHGWCWIIAGALTWMFSVSKTHNR